MAVAEVTAEHLRDALAAGATLIDVREPHEFQNAHVDGSVLIPLNSVPDRIDEFRSSQPVYVICRVGARSLRACEFLAERGIDAINVAGGILSWVDLGLPVVDQGSM